MTTQADVVIIGAGVMGAAMSFELSKQGRKVLCIDKNEDAGTGSTAGSCAIIRAHYSTYQGVALAYEGFFYFLDWENYIGGRDPAGMANYVNCGSVLLKTPGHDHRKVLKHYRAVGVQFEEWDLDTLKAKMPVYNHASYWPPTRPEDQPDYWNQQPAGQIDGAVYCPEGGYVDDPQLATHNIMHAAKAHGARTLYNKRVVAIHRDADKVLGVTLDDGQRIDAPVVVNAAGPHSFIINRMAGVLDDMNIKTRPMRQEVHHVPYPPGAKLESDVVHTSDGANGVYFRPCKDNTILVGSEDPECDPLEWVEDPDSFNRQITDSQWTAQVSRLVRRFENMSMPTEKQGLAELYDTSDDWIPIYDKSNLNGFYMAIGTSGNHFKTAPAVGYMMAQLIERCEAGQDHDHDPVVVQSLYKGLPLEAGFYSRRREINQESSFSVNG